MTALEIKNQVMKKFQEGQTITLRVDDDERSANRIVKVKIVKFYPNHVLTESTGHKDCYTYHDIMHMSSVPNKQAKEVVIPDRLRGSYKRHI